MTTAKIRKRLALSLVHMDAESAARAKQPGFSKAHFDAGWLRAEIESLIRDLTPAPRARKKAVTP